jgi:hypothetical protein
LEMGIEKRATDVGSFVRTRRVDVESRKNAFLRMRLRLVSKVTGKYPLPFTPLTW